MKYTEQENLTKVRTAQRNLGAIYDMVHASNYDAHKMDRAIKGLGTFINEMEADEKADHIVLNNAKGQATHIIVPLYAHSIYEDELLRLIKKVYENCPEDLLRDELETLSLF